MKNVFIVLSGDKQSYFIEQKNAENHANKVDGELFQEELTEKKFNELRKKEGFFSDMPKMEVKKNGKTEQKPEDLKKELEQLKKENEKLKKQSSLSFEDAAELYRKKADLLKKVVVFEDIFNVLNQEVQIKPMDNDSLHTDSANLVLTTGNYSHNMRERFKINNVHVINDFIKFTSEKVNQR